jgi:hypothetical protein
VKVLTTLRHETPFKNYRKRFSSSFVINLTLHSWEDSHQFSQFFFCKMSLKLAVLTLVPWISPYSTQGTKVSTESTSHNIHWKIHINLNSFFCKMSLKLAVLTLVPWISPYSTQGTKVSTECTSHSIHWKIHINLHSFFLQNVIKTNCTYLGSLD